MQVTSKCQKDKIVYYEDIVNTFSSFEYYPSEQVLRFIQNLRQGDEQSALTEFHNIINYIEVHFQSRIIQQYVCYDFINILIKEVVKMDINLPVRDTGKMFQFKSLDHLRDSMYKPIKLICIEMIRREESSNKRQLENIMHFIDDNFANPMLDLTMVADRFGMSIYKLSRVFNESIGTGFRKYITELRIKKSKNLLSVTDKSIKEIAYEIGFRDVSYFIKVFKNICGITPNKFKQ